jgi:hypothetical protein
VDARKPADSFFNERDNVSDPAVPSPLKGTTRSAAVFPPVEENQLYIVSTDPATVAD